MNADELLRFYERVADAPDAVAQLRRFVLDLAVRGKLVAQQSKDESAADLLLRIAKGIAERAARMTASDAKKLESIPEPPFPLPEGWAAATFRDVLIELQTGPFGSSLHQSDYQLGGTPVINPASIQNERIVPIEKMAVGQAALDRLRSFQLKAGDIVMARRGEMGRCALVTRAEAGWLCGTGSLILGPSQLMYARFLVLLIGTPLVRAYLSSAAVGATMQNLNQGVLLNLVFGLPPASEQARIVAKVDELMALCDRLEAARATREAARDRLAAASLARLNAPDPETFHEDARFALDPVPALTTRADQITQLRQTILNLAVRGKLVPQDPNDESAAGLLVRIARDSVERTGRAPASAAKKHDSPTELPFPLPEGWAAAKVQDILIELQTGPFGSSLHQSDYQAGGTPVINPASIQNERIVPIEKMAVGATTLERLRGFQLRAGDIVMARRGEMGRCALVTEAEVGWLCGTGSLILRTSDHMYARFLVLLIGTPPVRAYLSGAAVGSTMQNLNQGILLNLAFGLPPASEQARIVAKVDELMALCDRLEASLASTDTHRRRLLEALLHNALQPSDLALAAA